MIKKLFRFLNPDVKKQNITLDEVPKIVEERSKSIEKDNDAFNDSLARIDKLLSDLKEKTKLLENAELKNPDIEKRIKQIMEGNRTAYIKKLEIFLNGSKRPDSLEMDTLKGYILRYKDNIDLFNRVTAKSFYVLKEFFGDIMSSIATSLKKLDDEIVALEKRIDDSPSHLVANVKKKLNELNGIKEKLVLIEAQITNADYDIKQMHGEIEELDAKIAIMKRSEAYTALAQKNEENEECIASMEALEKEIGEQFSKVNFPLRKLDHMVSDRLIIQYVNDPLQALLGDNDLKILKILEGLKTKILQDTIQLRDRKRDSALEAIDAITSDYLSSVRKRYDDLEAKKILLSKVLLNDNVVRQISEHEYKKQHLTDKIARKKDEIAALEKSKSRYNMDDIKKQMAELLNKLTFTEVTID